MKYIQKGFFPVKIEKDVYVQIWKSNTEALGCQQESMFKYCFPEYCYLDIALMPYIENVSNTLLKIISPK